MSESPRIHSFPPIARRDARVLILGSMPSAASLAAQEYYAHPRNAFWPILGSLLGFDPQAPYVERKQAVQVAGIAIWDVLASCVRPGSLDSEIDSNSIIVNDFSQFFKNQNQLRAVYFNGLTAERCFRRFARTCVDCGDLAFHRLPSTSPAHAARNLASKVEDWRVILEYLGSR